MLKDYLNFRRVLTDSRLSYVVPLYLRKGGPHDCGKNKFYLAVNYRTKYTKFLVERVVEESGLRFRLGEA